MNLAKVGDYAFDAAERGVCEREDGAECAASSLGRATLTEDALLTTVSVRPIERPVPC